MLSVLRAQIKRQLLRRLCYDASVRFDYFGATDGHFHLFLGWPSPTNEERIWLPEPSATAQVERAIFELRRNAPYYLQRHADERVRRLHPEPATWSAACTRA